MNAQSSFPDSDTRIINGLSVDVEDWFQVGAFENVIERTNLKPIFDINGQAIDDPGVAIRK